VLIPAILSERVKEIWLGVRPRVAVIMPAIRYICYTLEDMYGQFLRLHCFLLIA